MRTLVMNIGQIPRKTKVVFPVQRIGFLIPHNKQERRTFTNKLELCIRLFSDTSCAIDEIDGKLYRRRCFYSMGMHKIIFCSKTSLFRCIL